MDAPVLLTGATGTSAAVFPDISKRPAVRCGALRGIPNASRQPDHRQRSSRVIASMRRRWVSSSRAWTRPTTWCTPCLSAPISPRWIGMQMQIRPCCGWCWRPAHHLSGRPGRSGGFALQPSQSGAKRTPARRPTGTLPSVHEWMFSGLLHEIARRAKLRRIELNGEARSARLSGADRTIDKVVSIEMFER